MIITSIFSTEENPPAFVRLRVIEASSVALVEIWKPKAQSGGLFQALSAVDSDVFLFNGTLIDGELHSFLAESAKRRGIKNKRLAKPFSSGDGLEIYRDMQAKNSFTCDCEGWNPLAAELNRIATHRTARAMAFLQGIIAADKEVNRPAMTAGFGMTRETTQGYRDAYGHWRLPSAPSFRDIL